MSSPAPGRGRDPLVIAESWRKDGSDVAIATVVETWGSAPRPVGSHLVIDGEGNFQGSVSGGCVEGAVVGRGDRRHRRAASRTCWNSASPTRPPGGSASPAAAASRSMSSGSAERMDPLALEETQRGAPRAAGGRCSSPISATARDRVVERGRRRLRGALGEAIAEAFRSGASGTVDADGRSSSSTSMCRRRSWSSIGAVHISQALAPMAKIAGFDMNIIDPRTAFATPDRFPDVPLHRRMAAKTCRSGRPLDRYTALAALTHDPKIDDCALKAALEAGCFYIGALGSRKTHAKRVERLRHAAHAEADRAASMRRSAFDIGASSPAEIAVAVLAEVIAALRTRGTGSRKKAKPREIRAGAGRRGRRARSSRTATRCRRQAIPQGHVLGRCRHRRAARARASARSLRRVLDADDLARGRSGRPARPGGRPTACRVKPPATGRVNLHAGRPASSRVDRALIDAHQPRRPGDHGRDLGRVRVGRGRARWWRPSRSSRSRCKPALVDAVAALCAGRGAFAVAAVPADEGRAGADRAAGRQGQRARQDASVTEARLARSGSRVTAERRRPHDDAAVAERARTALARQRHVVMFGASAMSDPATTSCPPAIRRAGGDVIRIGHAGRSRQPARPRHVSAASRCSARRAARAAPRKTASTGCSTG